MKDDRKNLDFFQEAVFIALVKAKMKDKRLTWEDIAKVSGYTVRYLQAYVSHGISYPLQLTLADILDIDLDLVRATKW